MGRIPPSQACPKDPRKSNPFNWVKTGISVNAAVPTESFLSLRQNGQNTEHSPHSSLRQKVRCSGRFYYGHCWCPVSDTTDSCRGDCRSYEETAASVFRAAESSTLQTVQYVPPNRRHSQTWPHGVTYKKTVSHLAVASFSYYPLSRMVQK